MVTIRLEVLGAKDKFYTLISVYLVSMFGLTNRLHYTLKIIKKVRLKLRYVDYMGKTTFKTIIIYFVPLLERPLWRWLINNWLERVYTTHNHGIIQIWIHIFSKTVIFWHIAQIFGSVSIIYSMRLLLSAVYAKIVKVERTF